MMEDKTRSKRGLSGPPDGPVYLAARRHSIQEVIQVRVDQSLLTGRSAGMSGPSVISSLSVMSPLTCVLQTFGSSASPSPGESRLASRRQLGPFPVKGLLQAWHNLCHGVFGLLSIDS